MKNAKVIKVYEFTSKKGTVCHTVWFALKDNGIPMKVTIFGNEVPNAGDEIEIGIEPDRYLNAVVTIK